MRSMMTRVVVLLVCAAVLAPAFQTESPIVRLPPSAFPELPVAVKAELERRGCTVPQLKKGAPLSNVIHGQFAVRGRADWAVLCSVQGSSSILVFQKGAEKNPASMSERNDFNYLQGSSPDNYVFGRVLAVVGKDFITKHYEAYGGPTPPPISHEGIEDSVYEKGSEVDYLYSGKWIILSGSD
jgi:hypothetical protein